ncbi:type II toxin-antitoxin system RelE/ParE family toxin [Croceicoccus naphthovorans]|uniref:Plasmid stabilization protein n=1 Tax=Croceicoccus naphthovorans TaxID=1348774 RepID=A0A0G3XFK9_9SPHN|nr:type II toxin-antitoxin system RelE/ParE family toxin [Croceicoccus naphthovorans]AKM09426.1 plasmid stabilization protein [Croceicoccus naphthovorans]MBB3992248.1 plasmid stabilization system protein ParE [Croceicoccus naphthovorans]
MTQKRKPAAAHVRITAGAERDLVGIYERRLAQRGLGGADGADTLLDELVAAIESLADFTHRGPVPPELDALGIHDFRQLSHPPNRIIYLPEQDGEEHLVTVMIVADSRRDFRTLLEERLLHRG